jgi:hypothetical protein
VTTKVLASASDGLLFGLGRKLITFLRIDGCETISGRGETVSTRLKTTGKKQTKTKKKKKAAKKVAVDGSHGTDGDGLALMSGRPVITIVNKAFDDSFFD